MPRGKLLRLLLSVSAFAGMALGGSPGHTGSVSINGFGGGNFNIAVTSLKEARFKHVVKQQFDFSCGSAAVATLLTYHYRQLTAEKAVFEDMYRLGDQEKIRKSGFSLLDMKLYLERAGYRANGYRVGLEKLVNAKVPAIVLINTRGYLHFVVIKGVRDEEVLVADPALGNKVIPRKNFEKMWNGVLFVILDRTETAKQSFNDDMEWRVRLKAPLGTALSRKSLATFTLSIPGHNFF